MKDGVVKITDRLRESKTNTDPESRRIEKQLWVQKLRETHRAVVLSAQAIRPAGPPAVTAHTGVVALNTDAFTATHTHARPNPLGQAGRIGFPHKGTFLPFICHVLNI